MGFVVTLQATENTAVQVGNVISTNPAANTSVLEGSTITVYYAVDTSAETQFKMPDLEGLSLEEAKKALGYDEVPVGAVIVYEDNVIAKAFNRKNKNERFYKFAFNDEEIKIIVERYHTRMKELYKNKENYIECDLSKEVQ